MGQKYLSVAEISISCCCGTAISYQRNTGKTNKDFVCGRMATLTVFPQKRKVSIV